MSSVTIASSPQDRLRSFGRALDVVHRKVAQQMGEEDVSRVRRLRRLSRGLEIAGRSLIHFSLEPVGWSVGVGLLFGHKQLEATEIGHPVLHGCYDKLDADEFVSTDFYWHIPIEEDAWRRGHNQAHHGYTNVAGADPDVEFGPVRLSEHVPHRWYHRAQLPFTLGVMWPGFALGMNTHFATQPVGNRKHTYVDAVYKAVPYYAKEYVFYPALAGPLFWKVAAGNWAAETLRNVYSAASIFCGHIGDEVDTYEEGTRAGGKGAWYAMQVQSTHNFDVPYELSVLCGGLDKQIEHHLFPKLPPERLRQIAPEVRQICEEHGVTYRSDTWTNVLGRALRRVWDLSFPNPEVTHAS